jgi:crotonobetainyl-CoA:carnitine CoA-transferase CaiB-like acyl-CoA transferase
MVGPLEGVRVLDLSRVLTGPFCSMLLGDLGAEVIKVEIPKTGDDTRQWGPPFIHGESAYFLCVNRNKKSMTLDLSKEQGQEILYALAAKSDVLLENFRPGVTERLHVDYPTLAKRNPRLIYCSITSYGATGPYSNRLAYDIVLQAIGGLMGVTGEFGRQPVRIGVALSDIGGGMYAAIAILAALAARASTDKGQHIDISLLDSTVSWMTYMAANFFATGRVPERMGSAHPTIVPYQCFETADGQFIALAIGNDKLFRNFCRAIQKEKLADDPQFSTNPSRVVNRDRLIPILEQVFKQKSRDEWLRILTNQEVPAGPVYSLQEVFSDPQVLHRKMLLRIQHPTAGEINQIGIPMMFSNTTPEVKSPPPTLGQHTNEVLTNVLGYEEGRIAKLRNEGVV